MSHCNIYSHSLKAICVFWLASAQIAQAGDLNIYAGPQSLAPRETVYVTIQSEARETDIELSYLSDGVEKILTGRTEDGLVSFELPAQKTVGHMSFTAKTDKGPFDTALVSVVAGAPQNFELSIRQGKQAESLEISSNVIRDAFGNAISDLALVSLDWVDDSGLISHQNTQLVQGRIALTANCPIAFSRRLQILSLIHI